MSIPEDDNCECINMHLLESRDRSIGGPYTLLLCVQYQDTLPRAFPHSKYENLWYYILDNDRYASIYTKYACHFPH